MGCEGKNEHDYECDMAYKQEESWRVYEARLVFHSASPYKHKREDALMQNLIAKCSLLILRA